MTERTERRLGSAAWSWLSTPGRGTRGVHGFGDGRFYVVLFMYLTAFLIFAKDPFFHQNGVFVYQQGIVTLLLGGLLAAALNWEMCIFGKPVGANLFLHVIQVFPLTLLVARLTARPSVVPPPSSFMGHVLKASKELSQKLLGDVVNGIPPWLIDVFSNWKICLFLALLLFFLCLRHLPMKLGAVICLFLVPLATVIQDGGVGHLLAGIALLGVGMTLQFCRYDRILYYENVFHRLQRTPLPDAKFGDVALRVMVQLENDGRLSEGNLTGIVRSEYGTEAALPPAELKAKCGEVLQKLVYEYGLAVLRGDVDGLFLKADPMLSHHDSLLTSVAVFPRAVLALLTAAIWVLLPVDVIPDAIPFLGMLDDVAVTIFSGLVLKNSLDSHVLQRQ